MFLIFSTVYYCDYLIEASWYNTLYFVEIKTWFFLSKVIDVVLLYCSFINASSLHVLFRTHNGVGFTTAGLTVREDGPIISIKNVLNERKGGLLVYLLLGSIFWEDLLEGEWSNSIIFESWKNCLLIMLM